MAAEKKFVEYRGIRMIEGWPEKIQQAQADTEYDIGGTFYQRIKYGYEASDWHAKEHPCHDCRVIYGEYHVPGCDVEECPACHGQAIGCDCED